MIFVFHFVSHLMLCQGLFLGSMYPTFSPQERGTMVSPWQVLPNGYGVSLMFPYRQKSQPNFRSLDFVVAKVTPLMITELGYKIFFQFGTINIIGMGIFSLYAVLYEPHLLLLILCLIESFPKLKVGAWKIWTLYLGLFLRQSARRT